VTHRIYLVGTDTSVGKTAVACALLRSAPDRRVRAAPFKPAQSGSGPDPSDVERLLRAADLPSRDAEACCPFSFDPPLAPGLAEAPAVFLGRSPPGRSDALAQAARALATWIARDPPDVVLIEGAGGLHVPMPGGTWQADWIRALADHVVIVARAGLGTINHTLLTIDALRSLGLPPLGFYTNDVTGEPDPSRPDNVAVITHARDVPHLGALPHRGRTLDIGPLIAALSGPGAPPSTTR
jgi:dethiobiotin synthetase